MLPTPTCLRLHGTRLRLWSQHSKIKTLHGSAHKVSRNLSHVLKYTHVQNWHPRKFFPKPCNLCGNVSRFLELGAIRKYSSYSIRDFGSDEEDMAAFCDVDYDFDEDGNLVTDPLSLIRVNLYPNSDDPVLERLTQAASVQDVFSIIEKHGTYLTPEQSSQAIVSLWDLQKVYGRYGIDFPSLEKKELANFVATIVKHPTFSHLLSHLEAVSEDLEYNAISCTLLYLHRLGIRDSSPLLQKLVLLSIKNLEDFSLSAISRLSVYLQSQGLGSYYLQSKIVSILSAKLHTISTTENLKFATICLYSATRLVSESLYERYDNLLNKLIKEGALVTCEPKVIIKFVKFLNQREWVQPPSTLYRTVLLHLIDKTDMLNDADIATLNHCFLNNVEPRELFHKIQERARYLVEVNKSSSTRARLMLCVAPYSSSTTRLHIEEFIVELLEENNFYEHISVVFKCLRSIRTSNFKLCNAFWTKALQAAETEINRAEEEFLGLEEVVFRRIYQHYMFFNNNLGGTYRYYPLEKKLIERFSNCVLGLDGLLPHKVAHMVSFIIAYNKGHGLPENIMERVVACAPQFTLSDVKALSRGIQICLMLNPNKLRRMFTAQMASLSHLLNTCTETLMKQQRTLSSVTGLMVAFLNRDGSPRTYLFDSLIEAHLPCMEELTSRSLRDISLVFLRTKYLHSEMLNIMIDYIIQNQDYLLADTMERFLRCLYCVGYHPKPSSEFFQACMNIYEKDQSLLMGLSYLEMSLTLCFYGFLPAKLINEVFNITFLDKLDEEIAACYSKGTYPPKVRHILMELNRAVCIDHPEEKIPWFHEKYCEDLLQTVAVPNKPFHSEVHQALSRLVGGADVVKANVTTPYFYLLDFEFILDHENRPVPISEYESFSKKKGSSKSIRIENMPGFRRMAVLLREEKNYCVNVRQLMGRHQMERRHLEILGYTVVEVPHFMWYSMALATHEDRLKYLKSLIFTNDDD